MAGAQIGALRRQVVPHHYDDQEHPQHPPFNGTLQLAVKMESTVMSKYYFMHAF